MQRPISSRITSVPHSCVNPSGPALFPEVLPMLRSLLAATLLTLPTMAAAEETAKPEVTAAAAKPRQLVIVSFDGAHDNRLWTKSMEMAKRTGAHFTYFLSCTF